MIYELQDSSLLDRVSGRIVLINNTFNPYDLGYIIAHAIRDYTRRLYCADERYKMNKEPEGYRVIENGRCVLVKADLLKEPENTRNKIRNIFGERADLEILMR